MTRDASRSRRSLPALATLSALAATTLSGCMWMSPVQTDHSYAPADGVDAQLGELKVTNLLVVAAEKGGAGRLVGQVSNQSDQPIQLSVQGVQGLPQVPGHGVLNLEQAGVSVPSVEAAPGGMTTVTLATPASGATPVSVPVLDASGPYASVTPGAAESTDAATETPSPVETSTAPAGETMSPTASETPGTVAPTP